MHRETLLVQGEPDARLRAGFAILEGLHAAFDRHRSARKGTSLSSCILSAEICVRALRELGFTAEAIPSWLMCITPAPNQPGKVNHYTIGSFDGSGSIGGWNGHMIVRVENFIFDPTFWQINKDKPYPIMLARPASPHNVSFKGQTYSALSRYTGALADTPCDVMWIDTPNNRGHENYWRGSRTQRRVLDALCADTAAALARRAVTSRSYCA